MGALSVCMPCCVRVHASWLHPAGRHHGHEAMWRSCKIAEQLWTYFRVWFGVVCLIHTWCNLRALYAVRMIYLRIPLREAMAFERLSVIVTLSCMFRLGSLPHGLLYWFRVLNAFRSLHCSAWCAFYLLDFLWYVFRKLLALGRVYLRSLALPGWRFQHRTASALVMLWNMLLSSRLKT